MIFVQFFCFNTFILSLTPLFYPSNRLHAFCVKYTFSNPSPIFFIFLLLFHLMTTEASPSSSIKPHTIKPHLWAVNVQGKNVLKLRSFQRSTFIEQNKQYNTQLCFCNAKGKWGKGDNFPAGSQSAQLC